MQFNKVSLSVLFALTLSACGGGDSSDDNVGDPKYPENPSPENFSFNIAGATSVVSTSNNQVLVNKSLLAASSTETSSNFYTLDDKGQLREAIESAYNSKVSYSVLSKDGNYLYVVIDAMNAWESEHILRATNCAIFKVNVKNNNWSCLAEGLLAEMPYGYWNEVNDGRFKPLQFDGAGNAYFLSRKFTIKDGYIEYDYSSPSAPLTRIDIQGNKKLLTTDVDSVSSFIVTKANSLVYRAEKLKMIPDLANDTLSTVELEKDQWSNGWYTVDDHNTVIYSRDNSYNNFNFAQASKVFIGGVNKSTLAGHPNQMSSYYLNSIIMGDDGYIYGVYNESVSDPDGNWYEQAHLMRRLPFDNNKLVTIKLPSDHYYNQNQQMQVAKGHAYYIEEESNLNYGQRDIIGITRIVDGETIKLFDQDWATQRLSIESWKLASDTLFFTGFDNASSTMVSGEIDTLALSQGKPESEYLTFNETTSVHGDALTIADMEVLRPQRPENSGGYPKVLDLKLHDQDQFSGTLEFNKWMNPQSVEDNLTITDTTNSQPIGSMVVWLNRMAHILFDQDNNQATDNKPLEWSTNYRVFIDKQAQDSDGISLMHAQENDAERTFDWMVRDQNTWKVAEPEHPSQFTDGNVLKMYGGNLVVKLVENIPSPSNFDYQVSFSTDLNERFSLTMNEQYNNHFQISFDNHSGMNNRICIYSDMGSQPACLSVPNSRWYQVTSTVVNKTTFTEVGIEVQAEDGSLESLTVNVPLSGSMPNYNFTFNADATNAFLLDNFTFIDKGVTSINENFEVLPKAPFVFTPYVPAN